LKSNIDKVDVACIFCGGTDRLLVTTGKEHEYEDTTDDVFSVVRCPSCMLTYLSPRPAVSELATIYPPNYYAYHAKEDTDALKPNSWMQRLVKRAMKAKILKGLSLCQKRDRLTILDVGCADGQALNYFREFHGENIETHGVDFSSSATEEAARQGHITYTGRFEDIDLPNDYFDLVVATHVIEHVENPRTFADKIYRILRPGGIFWFETPNISCLDAKIFKNNHWGGYHFPRHWFFFDQQSIKQLAKLTGYEIAMIDFYPTAVFWYASVRSKIISANPKLRGIADVLFPINEFNRDTLPHFLGICTVGAFDLAIKKITGQTDNMVVAFRKPG
jgi:2-polyprenyl-3-methyl-5-hydroxy-6-metoxy-1,4-benzoquinol methylase